MPAGRPGRARASDSMNRCMLLSLLAISAFWSAGALAQSGDALLTGRAAIDRIVGNTMVLIPKETGLGKDLKSLVYLMPDGRAAFKTQAGDGKGGQRDVEAWEGRWSVDDQERLCVSKADHAPRDRDCLGLTIKGNSIYSVPADAFSNSIATLETGNPYGL